MALINSFIFTRTLVDGAQIVKNFGNNFVFAASRPYVDKKGILPNGFTATLQVTQDSTDYGLDKLGNPRENNVLQTFDVTVLDGSDGKHFKKGDHVKLKGFRQDVSYAVGFDLLLTEALSL